MPELKKKTLMEAEIKMPDYFWGSICLDSIPEDVVRRVLCRDGVERRYVNIKVRKYYTPVIGGGTMFTHYVTCEPRHDMRMEGVNYKLGNWCAGKPMEREGCNAE